ncbi:GNAT family N-acetyltransferase [Marivita sp. S0852]|uniref:GNAT family N-acetyltransferase n=1 Tax=Marivita sp. S0852 TaxID=3373893 RepID=UPI00398234C0
MSHVFDHNIHILPSGTPLTVTRPRSDGVLCPEGIAYCRSKNIPIAFDPLQSGWVTAQVQDDLAHSGVHDQRAEHSNDADDLNLRAWTASDIARFVELLDDPHIWAHMPESYPDPLSPDLAKSLIEIANNSPHHRVYAILLKDVPVGQVRVEFGRNEESHHTAEISYWIGRAYWGQGIASAAVQRFAQHCLSDHPDLNALIARVKQGNAASVRVLEKAGFVQDGPDRTPEWLLLRRTR